MGDCRASLHSKHRSQISYLSPGGKKLKKISRLLIAYDGSECSDAMLEDVRRAGLPPAVEAVVATIAYVFVPPDDEVNETISGPAAAMVRPSQLRATEAVESALATAEQA